MADNEKNTSTSNNQRAPAVVRAEFAIVTAIVTLIIGFVMGRMSDGTSLRQPSRELGIEQIGGPVDAGVAEVSDAEWIAGLKRSAEESPDDADSWTRLGNAYFDTGQPNLAIEAYEKSLAISRVNPNVITDLGIMYRDSGDSVRAVELFQEAAALDEGHVMSRFNTGVVMLHDLENPAGALAAWKAVIEIDPQFRSPTGQLVADMVKSLEGE